MKEYGSNVQKLVDYIITIPDREKRTKHAHILVELMRQIHPNMRDGIDYSKKLWDDLYIMANFDLDVDSPFPAPPKEILGKKPKQIPYSQNQLKHRYYGRNLELLVLKAMLTENLDERKAFISYLVRLMKNFFQTWNKDTIETESCLQQILELSGFQLQKEIDDLRANGLVEDANPRDGQGHTLGKPTKQFYVTKPENGNHPRSNAYAGHRNKNNFNKYRDKKRR